MAAGVISGLSKRYGFIRVQGGGSVVFLAKDLIGVSSRQLKVGQNVEFVYAMKNSRHADRFPQARKVRVLGSTGVKSVTSGRGKAKQRKLELIIMQNLAPKVRAKLPTKVVKASLSAPAHVLRLTF